MDEKQIIESQAFKAINMLIDQKAAADLTSLILYGFVFMKKGI